MQTSENLNELATAMAKAQGEITGALKDSANPFFKSKYADLASCWDACRTALSKNGIAVIQAPETIQVTAAYQAGIDVVPGATHYESMLTLITTLVHSSGQWMRSSLGVNPKDDTPQSMGSALTYARRYALCAFVGVAQIDDDGNAASDRAYSEPHRPQGDIQVDIKRAESAAASIRSVLQADVDENMKAMNALDLSDELNRDQELYMAAGDRLLPKERAAFKAYVSAAKKMQSAEPMAANGRR